MNEPKSGPETKNAAIKQISRIVTPGTPGFHNAVYLENEGVALLSGSRYSEDNGRSWSRYSYNPDFHNGLPFGYRRERITSVRDHLTGRIITILNSLDTPGLDPTVNEPPLAQFTYYLRYTVSADAAKTWLFEDPIVQEGNYTAQNPFEGIYIGKNSIYLGDVGCIPIVTKKGKILVPAQTTLAGPAGELLNPGGGFTYTDVIVLAGTWTGGNKLSWKASQRVEADPERSTRGMIEPTLLELEDDKILMVMRGSNGGKFDLQNELPSYKWYSVSEDGGDTWSKPEPWCFEEGEPFFSPSSMSSLFRHSSGRCFWVGNMTVRNCQNNLPRWPLVIAEVDTNNLKLIRSSLLTVDTQHQEDLAKGRLDISHVALMEDRETKEIILTYPRNTNAYKSTEWVTVRFSLNNVQK
ncbi:MAG TPA: sialidase family protein [Anaerovoracaceae bacterium]|nr:sialidase family protein [Anaerovoracaceae bacterium]